VDFICFDAIIVELKAKDRVLGSDEAQVINYLKGSRQAVGLSLNFGGVRLEYRRVMNGYGQNQQSEQIKD
jgi:GxxExxY protein